MVKKKRIRRRLRTKVTSRRTGGKTRISMQMKTYKRQLKGVHNSFTRTRVSYHAFRLSSHSLSSLILTVNFTVPHQFFNISQTMPHSAPTQNHQNDKPISSFLALSINISRSFPLPSREKLKLKLSVPAYRPLFGAFGSISGYVNRAIN